VLKQCLLVKGNFPAAIKRHSTRAGGQIRSSLTVQIHAIFSQSLFV